MFWGEFVGIGFVLIVCAIWVGLGVLLMGSLRGDVLWIVSRAIV